MPRLSVIGCRLKKALLSSEGFSLVDRHGCGWLDGGCWSLSEGMRMWLQDVEMYCVYSASMEPQHVVIKVPDRDIFLDGEGISTEAMLKARLIAEGVRAPVTIAPFREHFCVETENGMQLWKATAREVTLYLERSLGSGPRFLWKVCGAEEDLE